MELATITMPKTEARKAFLEYRRAVRERHDEEDAEIMRAYREIARGAQLIRLTDALRNGGTVIREFTRWRDPSTLRLPRLSVARADARFVYTEGVQRDGSWQTTLQPRWDLNPNNRRDRLGFPAGTFEATDMSSGGCEVRAMVPTVPPPLRPVHKLSGYHLLWEAEWSLAPQPPGDPALLKRISRDLFAVVAIWDLTDVERAVLAGRTVEET